jgi:hypothetical protein
LTWGAKPRSAPDTCLSRPTNYRPHSPSATRHRRNTRPAGPAKTNQHPHRCWTTSRGPAGGATRCDPHFWIPSGRRMQIALFLVQRTHACPNLRERASLMHANEFRSYGDNEIFAMRRKSKEVSRVICDTPVCRCSLPGSSSFSPRLQRPHGKLDLFVRAHVSWRTWDRFSRRRSGPFPCLSPDRARHPRRRARLPATQRRRVSPSSNPARLSQSPIHLREAAPGGLRQSF